MAHHSSDLTELRKLFGSPEGLGPTGAHPEGHLTKDDEGEIKFAVAADPNTQTVILDFGKRIAWVGMTADQAIELADMLTKKAWLSRGIT